MTSVHQAVDRSRSSLLECSAARSAYVHVPFCRHRCGYCDFTLAARRDELIGGYLSALERELCQLRFPHPVDTLFLGGGTPTHLPESDLSRLCDLLRRWLPLTSGGEFSVEANPSGLDARRLAVLQGVGVNRVSLGVQSFDTRHLATLERDHRPEEIGDVFERLSGWCSNVSFDLIFAVPGQSLSEWNATLDAAIALGPQHLSTYGLTWERGTAFWSRRLNGTLQPIDEELERSMYALAMDRLPQAGWEQYELSNYARPGFHCRHNQVYWQGADYFGFGPGAASYLAGVRRLNHRSVTTWIKRTLAGESAIGEEERLGCEDRAREAVMLGLRQCDGIALQEFERRHGTSPQMLAPRAFEEFLQLGLCEVAAGYWRLTPAGRFVADRVISEFL